MRIYQACGRLNARRENVISAIAGLNSVTSRNKLKKSRNATQTMAKRIERIAQKKASKIMTSAERLHISLSDAFHLFELREK